VGTSYMVVAPLFGALWGKNVEDENLQNNVSLLDALHFYLATLLHVNALRNIYPLLDNEMVEFGFLKFWSFSKYHVQRDWVFLNENGKKCKGDGVAPIFALKDKLAYLIVNYRDNECFREKGQDLLFKMTGWCTWHIKRSDSTSNIQLLNAKCDLRSSAWCSNNWQCTTSAKAHLGTFTKPPGFSRLKFLARQGH